MGTMMMATYIFCFWMVYFVITIASWHISTNLVQPFNYWDCYPTKCMKCLTTWAMLAAYGSVAMILGSWVFFFCGMMITLLRVVAIIITENERFQDN